MVEIKDIKDQESLRSWLDGRREDAVAIAHRATMRVLPIYLGLVFPSETALKGEVIAISALRSSLISGVVVFCPIAEIKDEIERNTAAATTASDVASSDFFYIAEGSGIYSASAAAHGSTASSAAAFASAANDPAAWASLRADCAALDAGESLTTMPLWLGAKNPLAEGWRAAKALMDADKEDWSFWIKWFEAAQTGRPLPCDLLVNIARIKPEDWGQGPAHVNGLIAEIEAGFVVEALPQADRVDVDLETGLVETTPILTTAEQIVLTALKQVEFSYGLAKSGNCGLNFGSVASLYLEQTFENCRDDANAILQNYQVALDDIRMGLTKGDYQADGKLSALMVVLEKEIVNLLANHPEVKKADRARIAHHLSLARSNVKLQIVEELEFIKAAAGVRLNAEMTLDSKLVAQEGESPAQARGAQRLFGRMAQMYVTMKNASGAVVQKIDAATGYKFARILATLGKIVGWITSLFS